MKRVLIAPDKFRGTATAKAAAEAIARGASRSDMDALQLPLADGGEGTLEALGGPNRESCVTGPLGDNVVASWRLVGTEAVIELAAASGIDLIGGPDMNDPIAASTQGTGELINEALRYGARRIVVALGGSATTDGGSGILSMLDRSLLRECELLVACDVRTKFIEAATVFGPQKGATPDQVKILRDRLISLVGNSETLRCW